VNDFDLHYFYLQNPRKPRLARARKRRIANIGSFQGVPVDFIRTVIPRRVVVPTNAPAFDVIRAFLNQRPTPNARYLAEKAVIGLLPVHLFGKVIWPAG
jgi:hypothetical protein